MQPAARATVINLCFRRYRNVQWSITFRQTAPSLCATPSLELERRRAPPGPSLAPTRDSAMTRARPVARTNHHWSAADQVTRSQRESGAHVGWLTGIPRGPCEAAAPARSGRRSGAAERGRGAVVARRGLAAHERQPTPVGRRRGIQHRAADGQPDAQRRSLAREVQPGADRGDEHEPRSPSATSSARAAAPGADRCATPDAACRRRGPRPRRGASRRRPGSHARDATPARSAPPAWPGGGRRARRRRPRAGPRPTGRRPDSRWASTTEGRSPRRSDSRQASAAAGIDRGQRTGRGHGQVLAAR